MLRLENKRCKFSDLCQSVWSLTVVGLLSFARVSGPCPVDRCQPSARERNCIKRSLPPPRIAGSASTTSARGYQWGPKAGPLFHITTAPARLTTRPTMPRIIGVQHGAIGCKPRREVAARDTVHGAINSCKQEWPVEADHRLAPWWEDAHGMEHDVGAERQNDAREHSCEQGANASTESSRRRRLHLFHDPVALMAVDFRACGARARLGSSRRR